MSAADKHGEFPSWQSQGQNQTIHRYVTSAKHRATRQRRHTERIKFEEDGGGRGLRNDASRQWQSTEHQLQPRATVCDGSYLLFERLRRAGYIRLQVWAHAGTPGRGARRTVLCRVPCPKPRSMEDLLMIMASSMS